MTPAEKTTLRNNVQSAALNSPALQSALTARDMQAATDAYNATGLSVITQPVPITTVVAWAALAVRARIEDGTSNANLQIRSLSLTARDLFQGALSPTLDTVQHAGLLDALVAGGIVLVPERTALDALAVAKNPISAHDMTVSFFDDSGNWLGA